MKMALVGVLLTIGYPLDEGPRTEIRRLGWQQSVDAGQARGRKTAPGARLPGKDIELLMQGPGAEFRLGAEPARDPELQAGLQKILGTPGRSAYGVALLDLTDPAKPKYAGVRERQEQTPGSVAKLLVAAGLLDALARRHPDDIAAREAALRQTRVEADAWLMPNSHEVPVVDGTRTSVRAVKLGDTFTLWEWLDHAISPSSNAAGTLVWREATLMRLLDTYPPARRNNELWSSWPRAQFSEVAFDVVDGPQTRAGLDPAEFRLRTFFTKGAGRYLDSGTSRTSPLALLRWMLAVEQGRMVDDFSSLELKKLMYLTRRRIRYAKAPALDEAAVYFKSGSYFKCKPGRKPPCIQYQGDLTNVLNALVEVDDRAKGGHVYIVAVMSNTLETNSATEHERLAGEIHALVSQQ